MHFDFAQLEGAVRYKLMTSCVQPRPIAWITSVSVGGDLNAAPFSFFNVMGSAPPTVAIGLLADPMRGFKDTARNIMATEEFVVNLVPFALAEPMNITAVDAPSGVNELCLADLETVPSRHVVPPRIAKSPVAIECTMHASVVTGRFQTVVIGRVLSMYIEDAFVNNAERGHVHAEALDLVGRTHASGYVRTRERFELERPIWQDDETT